MTVRLFNQLSSLGDTIQRGSALRGQHELDMMKLGLQEKQIGAELANRDRDYALRLSADERAKQDQAMQAEAYQRGIPAAELQKDAAILEQERRNRPVYVKNLIGESKTAMEHAYWPDENNKTWVDDIQEVSGTTVEKEGSPYAGALVTKDGKPLTEAKFEQYLPQIEAKLKIRTDPERWVQGEARRLQERFDKSKAGQYKPGDEKFIDDKTFAAEKDKLTKMGSDESLLKAYQKQGIFLATLPGKEGQAARDRNEAKIKEVMGRIEDRAKEEREFAQQVKIANIKAKDGAGLGLKPKDMITMYGDANKYAKDKFELMYPADAMGTRYTSDPNGEKKALSPAESEKVFAGFRNEYLSGLGYGSPETPTPVKLSPVEVATAFNKEYGLNLEQSKEATKMYLEGTPLETVLAKFKPQNTNAISVPQKREPWIKDETLAGLPGMFDSFLARGRKKVDINKGLRDNR